MEPISKEFADMSMPEVRAELKKRLTRSLEHLDKLDDNVSEVAPDAFARWLLITTHQHAEFAKAYERIVAEWAVNDGWLSKRAAAIATGTHQATVKKWVDEPLVWTEYTVSTDLPDLEN